MLKIKGDKSRRDLIEAALYIAGRPLDLKTLASIIKTRSKNVTRRLAEQLKHDYDVRDTSLEILELDDGRFVLQLKAEYSSFVQRLALKGHVRPLLTLGPLKTLSYIAFKQPIYQRDVILRRGQHVYSHLKQLEELKLIRRDRKGRRKILRTTEYFAHLFGQTHDTRIIKHHLKYEFEKKRIKPPTVEQKSANLIS